MYKSLIQSYYIAFFTKLLNNEAQIRFVLDDILIIIKNQKNDKKSLNSKKCEQICQIMKKSIISAYCGIFPEATEKIPDNVIDIMVTQQQLEQILIKTRKSKYVSKKIIEIINTLCKINLIENFDKIHEITKYMKFNKFETIILNILKKYIDEYIVYNDDNLIENENILQKFRSNIIESIIKSLEFFNLRIISLGVHFPEFNVINFIPEQISSCSVSTIFEKFNESISLFLTLIPTPHPRTEGPTEYDVLLSGRNILHYSQTYESTFEEKMKQYFYEFCFIKSIKETKLAPQYIQDIDQACLTHDILLNNISKRRLTMIPFSVSKKTYHIYLHVVDQYFKLSNYFNINIPPTFLLDIYFGNKRTIKEIKKICVFNRDVALLISSYVSYTDKEICFSCNKKLSVSESKYAVEYKNSWWHPNCLSIYCCQDKRDLCQYDGIQPIYIDRS